MPIAPALLPVFRQPVRWVLWAWLAATVLLAGSWARAAPAIPLTIAQAQSVASAAASYPADAAAQAVSLPDDWSQTRPGHEGSVWYRSRFDRPAGADGQELLALYVERACSGLEVQLNGHRIHGEGARPGPLVRACYYPQLVTLPAALLQATDNVLDLRVTGHALERVAARQRAGGLSSLRIGPHAALATEQRRVLFWRIDALQAVNLTLAVIGCVIVAMGWLNRREAHMAYFGWFAIGLGLSSARTWARELPLDNASVELMACAAFAPLAALSVLFILSYAGMRSKVAEKVLLAQCVLMPASLLLAGPAQLFTMAGIWYTLLLLEVLCAMALWVRSTWRTRGSAGPMALLLLAVAASTGVELAVQGGLLPRLPVNMLQLVLPMVFIAVGARLLQNFARAMQAAEAGRSTLEMRVQEITAEIERNFAQLAELRVEQVTEKERKRIAGDLHDDLGAKLLTIVHTSESERISTLAREALEEMRLSVRGLTGKPMRLADALADWRAETVLRLGQANIEADWRSPAEEIEHLLPARGYVQTTRILREAVSNIIKHSGASHCKVRCAIADQQFGLMVQDNGRGIPMELDGKLDRGHGMSSMKHRAKQMQGQCLVESGPGYGTVIRLTLPL